MQRNRRWLLVLLLIGVFILAACDSGDDEDDDPTEEPVAQVEETEEASDVEPTDEPEVEETEAPVEETEEAPDAEETEEAVGNIVETVSAGDFTLLSVILEAASLTEVLSGEGPFTVFAPTDDAINAALATFGMDPTAILADTELLTTLLNYHVVEGELLSDAIADMDSLTTMGGDDLAVSVTDGAVVLNETVNVTAVDQLASNGVVHIIDAVLIPASVAEALAMDAEMTEEAPMDDMEMTEEPGMEMTEEADMEMTEEPDMEMTEEADMDSDEDADMGAMGITSACLVTDQGGVNDGTFNELAANAINQAAEDFGIEVSILESGTPTDFEPNIATCLESGAGAIVTVGFLLADATLAAAEANPDVSFIGVDQFFMDHPDNLVGLQFREDQSGFMAGVLAAQMSESGIIGGVYGIEIPPVVKFRNGFEQGAHFVNPDITVLGSYTDSFIDPAQGQEIAEAMIGEGADVIFGAGGATGSGGITYAAGEGVFVIGVDQDEYFTTFGGGESPGAEFLIGSAVKVVDVGVYNMLAALIDGSIDWQGGDLYILEAANGGIGLTEPHDADVPQEYLDVVADTFAMLADGSLETGVDPVTGALLDAPMDEDMDADADMEMTEEAPADDADEDMDSDEDADMGAMGITSACLVTDQGGVNDGTFNELAANAINQAAEDFGIEVSILESGTPTDFEPNIATCLESGAGAIVTVGFLLADATLAAAEANPDVSFIGVDQFFMDHPDNLVGLQFREDQSGFMAGVLAAQMSESGIIGGVYGIEIPPVVKFRNGFEQGAHFINPDITVLGSYTDSFIDPAQGQEIAEAMIGEGADVIFGAGGATGSGGITYAAGEGVFVIGVDQDEYFTTFGGGESPGAEFLIGSAVKVVDVGVYNMLAALIDGSIDWQGGDLYILEAANGGIGLTEPHDADVPQEYLDVVADTFAMLADGSLETGVDPVTGALLDAPMDEDMDSDEDADADMEMTEEAPADDADEDMDSDEDADMGAMGITSACLVTDQGGVNDGTFNELAANAINQAAEDFGIEVSILESGTPTDFEPNIATCLESGAGAIVTVGFLLADATLAAAEANPDVSFIGVDQFFMDHPDNLVGLQFREDQSGFMAGVLAAQMSESGIIGGVYGIEIPPVVKFRNGFEQGAHFINPDITVLGSYTDSFIDPAQGQEIAEAMIGEGADVIFGAGGATGSGGITYAAGEGVFVIGVDQDEYFTTFGGGESPGAEFLIGSAVKVVDVGVYNMLAALIDGSIDWQGGDLYILEAANGGIGLTEPHDADVPQEYLDVVADTFAMLADGSLETGVDPVTGALLDAPMDEDMDADAEATEESSD